VRGAKTRLFTPHPPLRGTLSLRERDSQNAYWTPSLVCRSSNPEYLRIPVFRDDSFELVNLDSPP
jgi:hypothetical protein